jgi:hypothetical protein
VSAFFYLIDPNPPDERIAVAELTRKPLHRIDLLSIVKVTARVTAKVAKDSNEDDSDEDDSDEDDSDKDDSDPSDIFSTFMAQLTSTLTWSPVLMLENCGAWMERRLLAKARHCKNVTRKCPIRPPQTWFAIADK